MKGTIDMKHLLLTSVLAVALTPAFSAENPVFKLFPGDVTFYLSFDEENSNADMAGGKGEPARKSGLCLMRMAYSAVNHCAAGSFSSTPRRIWT